MGVVFVAVRRRTIILLISCGYISPSTANPDICPHWYTRAEAFCKPSAINPLTRASRYQTVYTKPVFMSDLHGICNRHIVRKDN